MAAVGLELIFTVKVQLPLVHNIFRLLAPHSLVCNKYKRSPSETFSEPLIAVLTIIENRTEYTWNHE